MGKTLKQIMSKEELLACEGYNATFVRKTPKIGLTSIVSASNKKNFPKVEGNKKGELNYSGLTVLYNSKRKLPFVSAYNIDGQSKLDKVKRTSFRKDPRFDSMQQLDNDFYDLVKNKTEFEIGHMAANNEMAWGEEGQVQSYQTFHFPNSVPQAERLNVGIWRSLESYIVQEAAQNDNKKICVFTGPVLTEKDPFYVHDVTFRVPLLFFKVIVFENGGKLYSTGFIMSHEKKLIEDELIAKSISRGIAKPVTAMAFDDYTYKDVFQVNIKMIQELTGLKFTWRGVKKLTVPNGINQIELISESDTTSSAKAATRGVNASSTKKSSRITNLVLPK